jgi:hypothetical protein
MTDRSLDVRNAGDRLLEIGLVGLGRHFARQQHRAAIARDVHMATITQHLFHAVQRLQLDAFVVDLRA